MIEVSVIMPVYHYPNLLREAINSVLLQSFTQFELILVDDGSRDGCAAVCEEFAKTDARIVVVHKENEGAGAARNVGISYAKGKYILFVDADDLCHTDLLSHLWCAATENKADFVRCRFARFDGGGANNLCNIKPVEEPCVDLPHKEVVLQKVLLPLVGVCTKDETLLEGTACTTLFRHQILKEKNLAFTKERFGEDLQFVLSYLAQCECGVWLDEVLYFYRCTENSVTTGRYQNDKISWLFRQNKALLHFGKQQGFACENYKKRVAYRLLDAASVVCKEAILQLPRVQAKQEIIKMAKEKDFQVARELWKKAPLPFRMRLLYTLIDGGHFWFLRMLVFTYTHFAV